MMETDAVSKICLFVSNLPYSTTDAELEAVFKPHGALRSCYTVKNRGPSKIQCRGFGYVTYNTREDAQKALSVVKVIGGRPVQLAFAKRKKFLTSGKLTDSNDTARREGEGEEPATDDEDDYEALTARRTISKQRRPKSERGVPKFDVGRVVVLKNLPGSAKEKRLRKKCEKFGDIEEIVFPVTSEPSVAHVTFATHKNARLAVKSLNGTKYNKKSEEGVMEVCLLSLESKTLSSKTLKKSRLIVHNLSFKCSQEEVTEVFQKFGNVLRVDIPKKENGHMLGYAFVQFGSYFDAACAIAGVNNTEVKGRKVTVDWLLPKAEYKRHQQEEATTGKEEGEESGEGLEGEGEEGGEGLEEEGEEESEGWEELEEEEWLEEESEEGEGIDEDSEEEWESSDDEEDSGSSEDSEDETVRYKLAHDTKDVEEGRTLFIRNLPFTADRTEVKKLLMKFGLVRYCRLMLHPDTGVPTGSGFVQFKTPSAAQKCLRAANESEKGVAYEDQTLNISLAIPRTELEKAQREGTEKEDKRNLYLAKEGVIFPRSDAAKDVSKADMTKRTKAYAEKKAKLAKPHFYVSRTRLCVRNLPTSVEEKKLKSIFEHATATSKSTVVQVKILRSTERVDSNGVGRSMGYGFVEFKDHDSALAALRATNNNPQIFGKTKRPIVDFAVEDSRIMKIRERRLIKQQSMQRAADDDGTTTFNKRLARRKKWQSKWQSRRQKRKEAQLANNEEPKSSDSERVKVQLQTGKSRKRKSEDTEDGGEVNQKGGKVAYSLKAKRRKLTGGRRSHNDQEERKFADMVTKYRRKMGKLS